MKKLSWIIFFSFFLFLALFILLWTSYFRAATITIKSNIPGISPAIERKKVKELVNYLDTIHFWNGGVVYGEYKVEGEKKVEGIDIVLVDRELSLSLYTDGVGEAKTMYSREFFVDERERGVLVVGIEVGVQGNLEKLDFYVLNQLYKIAVWPRKEIGIRSLRYRDLQSEFAQEYMQKYGGFIEYEK